MASDGGPVTAEASIDGLPTTVPRDDVSRSCRRGGGGVVTRAVDGNTVDGGRVGSRAIIRAVDGDTIMVEVMSPYREVEVVVVASVYHGLVLSVVYLLIAHCHYHRWNH
ncbi:conserved hypothetical protein [Ricinus communis]|uniref:Uncharacterized protein n=1 Tax=Ricinus communis TaxID=3988 RepID=B9SIB6_RICCO|nr:conserved hypothetical protein [Ricinus communis]